MAMPASSEPAFIVPSVAKFAVEGTCKIGSHAEITAASPSRSTSPGSTSPLSSPGAERDSPVPVAPAARNATLSGLPDYEYPVPFAVRNTFIDMQVGRPLSLDEFYEERRVHSCPVAPPPGLGSDSENLTNDQMRRAMTAGAAALASRAAAAAASAAAAVGANRWAPFPLPTAMPDATTPSCPPQATKAPVLRLADALVEPEVGSAEAPTVGSKGHRLGTCKPCAFFHTRGCGNGVECSFCHLCPQGEKKRRQKEKGEKMREMQRMGVKIQL